MLEWYKQLKVGVFRVNALYNLEMMLGHANYKMRKRSFKSGESISTSNLRLYFDSFASSKTWSKTPQNLDFMVAYPIDSLSRDNNQKQKEFLSDIDRRNIKKVFICSWNDDRNNYSWLEDIIDRTIIYDAEE